MFGPTQKNLKLVAMGNSNTGNMSLWVTTVLAQVICHLNRETVSGKLLPSNKKIYQANTARSVLQYKRDYTNV
jgi:hypothetical protein